MNRSDSNDPLVVAWRDPQQQIVFDTMCLSGDQRRGDACVLCGKRWPRPTIAVGSVPDGTRVRACHECADLVADQTITRLDVRVLLDGARDRILDGCRTPLTAVVLAAPAHARCARGCRACALLEAGALILARHVYRTELLTGPLPDQVMTLSEAQQVLDAWMRDAPPPAVLVEAVTAAIAELAPAEAAAR